MSSSSNRPFLRLDGDLFFNHQIGGKTFRIQVTHSCLGDVFGSDGSMSGDGQALNANLWRIVEVAAQKAMTGADSPIKVLRRDFNTV
ncbi:hypothetical protein NOV72_03693 [Caballeronia novacaledonica]|uniref:Uncharacterized protein n=1 Tax=Caballeronia novacaledonica TaxID=1544861 RepID=A0A2U3I8H5_9BURK|nr:hypothetical protein [Caballeronia novacaledonica]SPB16493.1 hypothetical protein NOV72_03693 [Caballeronia novacaledonica]